MRQVETSRTPCSTCLAAPPTASSRHSMPTTSTWVAPTRCSSPSGARSAATPKAHVLDQRRRRGVDAIVNVFYETHASRKYLEGETRLRLDTACNSSTDLGRKRRPHNFGRAAGQGSRLPIVFACRPTCQRGPARFRTALLERSYSPRLRRQTNGGPPFEDPFTSQQPHDSVKPCGSSIGASLLPSTVPDSPWLPENLTTAFTRPEPRRPRMPRTATWVTHQNPRRQTGR